ncbi:leukemia inhibitory factor receptor [Symphorus nematophorus]
MFRNFTYIELHCVTVFQLPKPSISHLQAISDKQILVVRWLENHSGLVGKIYEIQISRTENHTVIYSTNVSLSSVDSDEYTWTWTSDLPLECVDHSVRIRYFYNQSVPSPWSNWTTNYGAKAEGRTKMFPCQRVLREGSSAMFCCVPQSGVNITNMTLNNSKYTIMSIGARVKAITVENVTNPEKGIRVLSLFCQDSTGKESYVWNYVSFPPQKPSNLDCVTTDRTTLNCTWDSGRKRYENDRNKQTNTLHIENSDQPPINCEPSSCIFPAVPRMEEYNIRVVVKDQLGEETESYSFNISDRVSPFVEWNRVIPGVTDTTVSWNVHGNLTHLNLFCQVATDPGTTTELSCSSANGLCTVKLEHLLPNTRYSTKVHCSVNGRFWGEWAQPRPFTTYPLVTLDVWRRIEQLTDPNSRQVTLLWTPHVPGSAAMVNIQGYTVQWLQGGQNWTKGTGQTQAEVSIGPEQCDFTVQAILHTGSSIPAHITIPQRDDGENLLVEKQLSSSSAAGFNLSWEEQDTATCGYTVDWCILGNVVPCTLHWKKMPLGNNTLFLPASNFTAGCRYTFNIYGCTENGHKLLEIQTGYSQELQSVQSPFLVEPVQSTSSSVTLEWHYSEDDPAHSAFITGYLVMVQEVGSDTQSDHAANLFNMSVGDPHMKSVMIEGLQHSTRYAFSVSALTKEGPGQPALITVWTRANYFVPLAKILTPILLVLCCTILLWPRRKMLKSGLRSIFVYPAGMNIRVPELDSFLPETSERLQSEQVEDCSCDIEILNIRHPLTETTTLSDPELLNTLPSPGSQSSTSMVSCVLLQADYCPQSATGLLDRSALQQTPSITNKTYFHTKEDLSEAQQAMFSEINEPSESLKESCMVIYGYIATDA